MKPTRHIILLAIIFRIGLSTATAEQFYILQDGFLSFQKNGDSSTVNPDEWQIRLFPLGIPTNSKSWWGLITGKTIESVQKQLKSAQDFETTYNKWSGTIEQQHTYFNPLGPIAKMPDNRPRMERSVTSKAEGAVSRMLRLMDLAKAIADIAEKDKMGLAGPIKNVGALTKEYFDNLRDAQSRLVDLQARLDSGNAVSDLDQILASIDATEKAAGALTPSNPSSLSISSPEGNWNVRFGGGGYVNYEATFTNIKGTVAFAPDGSVKTGRISLVYSERALNAASVGIIPKHQHTFTMSKITKAEDGVMITFAPDPKNAPPCELRLKCSVGGTVGELTINRIDLGPPFNFSTTNRITLTGPSKDRLAEIQRDKKQLEQLRDMEARAIEFDKTHPGGLFKSKDNKPPVEDITPFLIDTQIYSLEDKIRQLESNRPPKAPDKPPSPQTSDVSTAPPSPSPRGHYTGLVVDGPDGTERQFQYDDGRIEWRK